MNATERLLEQTPPPGERMVRHRGDVLTVALRTPPDWQGEAYARTNIGRANVRRNEIVRRVEQGEAILARDWHDIRLIPQGDGLYTAAVPLCETGRFEIKAFWLPRSETRPVWPAGPNTVVKVEPADCACANAIYSAFVRQFGPHRSRQTTPSDFQPSIRALEEAGYAVIPVSGTFRELASELDTILCELGFGIVHLLPVHPIPTTYARMGRFGSPFAALDYMDVDPALAEFDRRTTPLEQFDELTDAIHARGARVFMDIPVNHTGWASRLQIERPEWFVRDRNRQFLSPGAWGVTWEDLSELDYRHAELWRYMADVFLFWARRGVDGFRCDAGYKVPYPAWEYMVAKVRLQYPDTVFFLEGLGGKISTMEALLDGANMDWAYSELFQDYARSDIERQWPLYDETSRTRGLLVHFAETHDNNRLAARSPAYARMRVALSALLSRAGGWGMANGAEWLATEKIDVHGAPSLRWGAEENLKEPIRRLNALLRAHPCFGPDAHARLIHSGGDNAVALRREAGDRALLVLANLRDDAEQTVVWRRADFAPKEERPLRDLIAGQDVPVEWTAEEGRRLLAPGEVVCLSAAEDDGEEIEQAAAGSGPLPEPDPEQAVRAQYFDVRGHAPLSAAEEQALPGELRAMTADPMAFCAALSERRDLAYAPPGAVCWTWPGDLRRTAMLPPRQILCVTAPHRFRATLEDGQGGVRRRASLPSDDGRHFALFPPRETPAASCRATLRAHVFAPEGVRHDVGAVLRLADGRHARARLAYARADIETLGAYAVLSNERGAMVQARGCWGKIVSQYDALLAGNPHPDCPADRQVMLTRCRAWLLYRGHWQDLDGDCTEQFSVPGNRQAHWRFRIPVSGGKTVTIEAEVRLSSVRNATRIVFMRRKAARRDEHALPDAEPVEIVVRPDIEDRTSHGKTKAFAGPETNWPSAVRCEPNGFVFAPDPNRPLAMRISEGEFRHEPEWMHGVSHPFEADRGLDGMSDLYSPGYFSFSLKGGEATALEAAMGGESPVADEFADEPDTAKADSVPLVETLRSAMNAYVTRRGENKTVLAGFPWFLDWGRDTLIALRGMIAAGMRREARAILTEFARFEAQGTLPNMIRGDDVSNRDTSDAPLWLFTACADLIAAEGADTFLAENCGGRTVRDALLSIGSHYRDGTPNGIRMDADSALIFSPSHFTWMDTNFPAGTPREGYPVEIQALWHAALRLLSAIEPTGDWSAIAERVRDSLMKRFPIESDADGRSERYLADCLRAAPGMPAVQAEPDDALRPNQLLAITLGAVQDRALGADILRACAALLVPGAIRSLADRPVRAPLPIRNRGALLNDPLRPYWGAYRGDEDTRRKPAYHNGTAWVWPYPSFAEALPIVFGARALPVARAYAAAVEPMLNAGCARHLPEIADGDAPHAQRGCGAQAWSVSEAYRVHARLTRMALG